MTLNKYILWGILSVIMLGILPSVYAISISNENLTITCLPDEALIQYGGYSQKCSIEYFPIFENNLTTDIVFCFGETITPEQFLYNGIDVLEALHYKTLNLTSPECYYILQQTFEPNTTQVFDLWYRPNSIDEPKWDMFLGDTTNFNPEIILILDPLFNATLYEIGSDRSNSYWWTTSDILNYNISLINTDINSTGNIPFFTRYNVSNVFRNYSINTSTNQLATLSASEGAGVNTASDICRGITFTPRENIRINTIRIDTTAGDFVDLRIYAYTPNPVTQLLYKQSQSVGPTNTFTINYNFEKGQQYIVCSNTTSATDEHGRYTASYPFNVSLLNFTEGANINLGNGLNSPDNTYWWNIQIFNLTKLEENFTTKNNSIISSNTIALSYNVSSFQVKLDYVGNVSMAISFDGNSNTTTVTSFAPYNNIQYLPATIGSNAGAWTNVANAFDYNPSTSASSGSVNPSQPTYVYKEFIKPTYVSSVRVDVVFLNTNGGRFYFDKAIGTPTNWTRANTIIETPGAMPTTRTNYSFAINDTVYALRLYWENEGGTANTMTLYDIDIYDNRSGSFTNWPYTIKDSLKYSINLNDNTSTVYAMQILFSNETITTPGNVTSSFSGTDFSAYTNEQLQNLSGVYLYNSFGRVEWNVPLNVTNINFNTVLQMTQNSIYLNSVTAPKLNYSANITFNTTINNPTIYKDGIVCTTCTLISNSGGLIKYGVIGFSNYTLNETNLTNSLLAYYSYDTSTVNGTTVRDVATGLFNGTIANAVSSNGILGQAYYYNGSDATDQYISYGYYELGTTPFTVSLWFKTNTTGDTYRALFGNNPNGGKYFQIFANAGLQAETFAQLWDNVSVGYDQVGGFYGANNNTWQHLVVSRNGTIISLYLNGVLKNTTTDRALNISGTIGQYRTGTNADSSDDYDGYIDELGVWTRVLTPTEITTLYNNGIGLSYPFNETYTPPAQNISGYYYWKENSTIVWTNISLTAGVTKYVQIASASNATANNGSRVFQLFDDFNDGILDTTIWGTLGNGTYTEANGVLNLSVQNRSIYGINKVGNISMVVRAYLANDSANIGWGLADPNIPGEGTSFYFFIDGGLVKNYSAQSYTASPPVNQIVNSVIPMNTTFHKFRIDRTATNATNYYIDDAYLTTGTAAAPALLYAELVTGSSTTGSAIIDYVYVYPYSSASITVSCNVNICAITSNTNYTGPIALTTSLGDNLTIQDTTPTVTGLYYWKENASNVWTNLSLTAGVTRYFNMSATTLNGANNGNLVFPIFDDFNDATLNTTKWTLYNGTATEGGGVLNITGNNSRVGSTTSVNNATMVMKAYYTSGASNMYGPLLADSINVTGIFFSFTESGTGFYRTQSYNGTTNLLNNTATALGATYHKFKIDRNGNIGSYYLDDVFFINHTMGAPATLQPGLAYFGSPAVGNLVVDQVYVYPYSTATITVSCANDLCSVTSNQNYTGPVKLTTTHTSDIILQESNPPPSNVSNPDPYQIVHYKFENSIIDYTNNSNNGTNSGGTYNTPGKLDTYSWYPSSGSEYFTTPSNSNFTFGTNPYVIAFWFNVSSQADNAFRVQDVAGTDVFVWYNSNFKVNYCDFNLCVVGINASTAGVWHHVVAQRNNAGLELWIDGVFQNSSNGTAFNMIGTQYRWGYTTVNKGAVEDFRMYKGISLSSAQIATLYNSGVGNSTTNLYTPTLPGFNSSAYNYTFPYANNAVTSNNNLTVNFTTVDPNYANTTYILQKLTNTAIPYLKYYFPLDGNYTDASTNNINMSGINTSFITGKNNQGVYFPAANNSHLEITGYQGLPFQNGTLSFWINATNPSADGSLYTIYGGSGCSAFYVFLGRATNLAQGVAGSRKVSFAFDAVTSCGQFYIITCNSPLIDANQSYFITTTWGYNTTNNLSNMKIYINGTLCADNNAVLYSGNLNGSAKHYIGSSPFTSDYFKGSIDEISYYTKAFSSTQVQELYNHTLPFIQNTRTVTTTNTSYTWTGLTDAKYYYGFTIYDTYGNSNYYDPNVTIDTTPPNISFSTGTTPNASYISGSRTININLSLTEDNPNTTTTYLYNATGGLVTNITNYFEPDLTEGLLVYYGMENTATIDNTGKYNMTIAGTPTYTTGKIGNAMLFNGSQDITVYTPDGASNITNKSYTINVWIKKVADSNPAANDGIFSTQTYDGSFYRGMSIDVFGSSGSDDIDISFWNDTTYNGITLASSPLNPSTYGQWFMLTFVRNVTPSGDIFTTYIDGIVYDTQNLGANSIISVNNYFLIGHYMAVYADNIYYDEYGFWNRSLSDIEVTELYNGGTGISYQVINGTIMPTIQFTNLSNGRYYYNATHTDLAGLIGSTPTWYADIVGNFSVSNYSVTAKYAPGTYTNDNSYYIIGNSTDPYFNYWNITLTQTTYSLLDNLVAYFDMNEPSGNIYSRQGNYTGTQFASVGSGTGIIGGARDFIGVNNYFLTNINTTPFVGGSVSINAWYKGNYTDFVDNAGLVTIRDHPSSGGLYPALMLSSDGPGIHNITSAQSGTQARGPLLEDDQWHMYTSVFNTTDNSYKLYIDGALYSTGSNTNEFLDMGTFWYIGSEAFNVNARSINGSLDEIGIWKKTLTSTEVSLLYNGGRGYNGFVSYNNVSTSPNYRVDYTGLSDGIYYNNITAIDLSLNTYLWQTNFTVDTTPPIINFSTGTTPNASYIGASKNIFVNITAFDTNWNITLINLYNSSNSLVSSIGSTYNPVNINITGGIVTNSGLYTIHTFLNNGTLNVTGGNITVEVLVVAGGGGGGDGGRGGGGGAGGLIYNTTLLTAGTYPVGVGQGGQGAAIYAYVQGQNGTDSSFATFTAKGGGGGGGHLTDDGLNGGSGGGGASYAPPGTGGTGIVGQGNNGGTITLVQAPCYGGGGGGGAGEAGQVGNATSGGRGGNGLLINISGTPTYYAGGGGSGVWSTTLSCNAPATPGGLGGGGSGAKESSTAAVNAVPNTGGGGGGGTDNRAASSGASGIVIIRYLTPGPSNISVNFTNLTTGRYYYNATATDLAGLSTSTATRYADIVGTFNTGLYNNTFPYANNAYTSNTTLTYGFNTTDTYYNFTQYSITGLSNKQVTIIEGPYQSSYSGPAQGNKLYVYYPIRVDIIYMANDTTATNASIGSTCDIATCPNFTLYYTKALTQCGNYKCANFTGMNVLLNPGQYAIFAQGATLSTNFVNVYSDFVSFPRGFGDTSFVEWGTRVDCANANCGIWDNRILNNYQIGFTPLWNISTTNTSYTTTLPDGKYYYDLTVYDKAGNSQYYDPNITIDTTPPVVNFSTGTTPNGSYINIARNIFVNISINETNLNTSIINLYNSSGSILTPTPDTSSLVNYWKLDETSGNASDSKGTATLIQNGIVPSITGKLNTARGGGYNISNYPYTTSAMPFGYGYALSISGWFNNYGPAPTANSNWVWSTGINNGDFGIDLICYDGAGGTCEPHAYMSRINQVPCTHIVGPNISRNTWHFAVITQDPITHIYHFYIDGVYIGNQSGSCTNVATNTNRFTPLLSARYSVGFNGSVDEIGLWNKTLNATEVSILYSRTSPLQPQMTTYNFTNLPNGRYYYNATVTDLVGLVGTTPTWQTDIVGNFTSGYYTVTAKYPTGTYTDDTTYYIIANSTDPYFKKWDIDWNQGLSDKLLVYYDFNEPDGSVAYDKGLFGLNITQSGVMGRTTGVIGNAATGFNNTNYYRITDNKVWDLPNASNPYTLNMWVKRTATNPYMRIIERGYNAGYTLMYHTDLNLFLTNPYAVVVYDNPLTLNEWHMVSITYNGTHSIMRVDNNDNLSAVLTDSPYAITSNMLSIGHSGQSGSSSYPWGGDIDELGIWNRTLTRGELSILYNDGLGNNPYTYYNYTGLTDGYKAINITATDLALNTYLWQTYFTIDTIYPTINFSTGTTANGSYIASSRTISVNLSVNDTNLNTTTINLYNSTGGLVYSQYTGALNTTPLTTGLINYWPFDNSLNDLIDTNTANGTYAGFGSGQISNAIYFDGTNGPVLTGIKQIAVSGNSPRSMSGWFKANTYTADDGIMGLGGYYGTNKWWGFAMDGTAGAIRFYSSNGYNVLVRSSGNTSVWYMLTATYDGTTTKIYVDGVNVANGTGQTLSTEPLITLGSLDGIATTFMDGYIDDFSVWNRTLNNTEVSQLYALGVAQTGTASFLPVTAHNFTNLPNGRYYYNATATDIIGQSTSTPTWYTDIVGNFSTGYYTVMAKYPTGTYSNDPTYYLIVNSTDPYFASWNITLNTQNNYSTSPDYRLDYNLSDNNYYVNITAKDLALNTYLWQTYFTIDTIYPTINFSTGTTPNNTVLSTNNIFINITYNESNAANGTISLYDTNGLYSEVRLFYDYTTNIYDDFNDASINTSKWTVIQGSVVEENGYLRLGTEAEYSFVITAQDLYSPFIDMDNPTIIIDTNISMNNGQPEYAWQAFGVMSNESLTTTCRNNPYVCDAFWTVITRENTANSKEYYGIGDGTNTLYSNYAYTNTNTVPIYPTYARLRLIYSKTPGGNWTLWSNLTTGTTSILNLTTNISSPLDSFRAILFARSGFGPKITYIDYINITLVGPSSNTYINFTNLPNGRYYYNATITDRVGYSAYTDTWTTYVLSNFSSNLYNVTFPYADNAYTTNNTLTYGFNTTDPYYNYTSYYLRAYNTYPFVTSSCFQESFNTSNQTGQDGSCGLLYTGTSNVPSIFNDGNYTSGFVVNNSMTYYINYTLPSFALNRTVVWTLREQHLYPYGGGGGFTILVE